MFSHQKRIFNACRRGLIAGIGLMGVALVAGAQKTSANKPAANQAVVQYWMDVATVTVSGMTHASTSQDAISTDALGQMTGNNSTPFGGTKGMKPGRWLDVALAVPHGSVQNENMPFIVLQTIPQGQKMGGSLQLARQSLQDSFKSPTAVTQSVRSRQMELMDLETVSNNMRDLDAKDRPLQTSKAFQQDDTLNTLGNNSPKKLLLYWGCGDRVRAGQPRHLDMLSSISPASGYKPDLRGRAVIEHGPSPETGAAIWPNTMNRALVPKEASLVGKHALRGGSIPANMQFELKNKQDFMPALTINVSGVKGSATALNWSRIPTAQGYFLMATAKTSRETIIWTSSELPEPGWGLMDYVSNANLSQWKREQIVLAPTQTSCSIPAGIFNQSNGAILNGIAYGEEAVINNSVGNWRARIRVKSATMQPFDEFILPLVVVTPNVPTTLLRTISSSLPSTPPDTEETLNRLLIQSLKPKPPKCDPCVKPPGFL